MFKSPKTKQTSLDQYDDESIEEFAEMSDLQDESANIIQIFKKFATQGQMSKTEYAIVRQYAIKNINEIEEFIQKIHSHPGFLGQYDLKLADILNNNIVCRQKQNDHKYQNEKVKQYVSKLKQNNNKQPQHNAYVVGNLL